VLAAGVYEAQRASSHAAAAARRADAAAAGVDVGLLRKNARNAAVERTRKWL